MQHRWHLSLPLIISLVALSLLFSSCVPQTVVVTVTTPPELIVVTVTPSPTSPAPHEAEPDVLTICLDGEPDTLYLYGGSHLAATRHVMAALYDGPIDYVNYRYQPVILEKIPSMADGDAVIRRIRVHTGDRVASSEGDVVKLQEGTRVRPAGCYADTCAVEFDGQGLFMEKLEVTFSLKGDLRWSDGEPLTAADSVFAYRVASSPDTPGHRYLAERTQSYRALDEQRVKWMGLPGFVNHDYATNFFDPLPSHQLKGRSPSSLLSDASTRRSPLSWGPYSVEEWVAGDHLTVTRNEWYFGADEGLPAIDRIVFRFTSGAEEMVSQVVAGECDVAVQNPDFEPLLPLLEQLDAAGLVNLLIGSDDSGWQLDFGISPMDQSRRGSLFADLRVRQAFAQCIDRRTIVDQATMGAGDVPNGVVPSGHPLFSGAQFAYWDYNPAAGRALLGDVGWLDEDEDGVLEAKGVEGVREDTPFVVTLLVPVGDEAVSQVAQVIRSNMVDCGVRVDLEPVFYEDLIAPGPDGPLFGRRFDMALTEWQGQDILRCDRYLSSEIPTEDHWDGANVTGYVNLDYDAVCLDALGMLPGMADYTSNYQAAQLVLSDELPSLPLFMRARIAFVRPGVTGITLDATAETELWSIEEVILE